MILRPREQIQLLPLFFAKSLLRTVAILNLTAHDRRAGVARRASAVYDINKRKKRKLKESVSGGEDGKKVAIQAPLQWT